MIRRTWTYVSNNALLATIIGGLVLLGLGTWRWSYLEEFFGATARTLSTVFVTTLGWLEAPANIPRWFLLVVVASIFLLVRTARRHGKAIDYCARVLNHHVMDRHVPPIPEPPPEPEPEKVVDDFTPTPGQLALLQRPAGPYQRIPFQEATKVLKRIDSTAEWDDTTRALKILRDAGAVVLYGPNGTDGYKMTEGGFKYLQELKERRRI